MLMENNYLIENHEAYILLTVGDKTILIPRDTVDGLCQEETFGTFWRKLQDYVINAYANNPEIVDIIKQLIMSVDNAKKVMNEIKRFGYINLKNSQNK